VESLDFIDSGNNIINLVCMVGKKSIMQPAKGRVMNLKIVLLFLVIFFSNALVFADPVLREDVQKFIDSKYPDSELIKTMLSVYAQGIQIMIADANDEQLSIQHQDASIMLGNCTDHILWRKKIPLWKWLDIEKEIRAKVINTPERKKEYKIYRNQGGMRTFTGSIPSGPEEAKKFCPFDPDLLKN